MKAIGIDIGGTKMLVAKIQGGVIVDSNKVLIDASASQQTIINQLVQTIQSLWEGDIQHIGVGVPSVVDPHRGIVYDVQNIPSWKKVYLKSILENSFSVPVYLNNDVNCAAVGEKFFGFAKNINDFVMLNIGTGMAAGIFLNNTLIEGLNCGAGEFGMIDYRDHNYEYYCSGQFFDNIYQLSGDEVYNGAKNRDPQMLKILNDYGTHLGRAVKTILYALAPSMIILCGSVSKAFTYFEASMRKVLRTFAYQEVLNSLEIKVSENENIGVIGAAALHYLINDPKKG